jgi:hypothetical protein
VKPILANEIGSNPTKTRVGDNHYLFALPYDDVDVTVVGNLRTLAAKDDPFLMIDYDGSVYEAVIDGDTLSERLDFDVPELFRAELRIRTLG